MAVTYGFYNSLNGDRKYYAEQISKIVDALVVDGVFMHIEQHLNVKQGTGMQVLVEPGFAWFNHTWTQNGEDYPLTIEEADILQPRIDAVVLEVNEAVASRENSIKIIKGAPASSPQKPALTNTTEIHQYPLAYVSVAVGTSQITNANIENRIGMSDCPFATGVLKGMNIDTLVQEWAAQFDEWFKSLEDTLSGDVAGNLLLKIEDLEKHAIYQYSATFKMDSWSGSGPYTQTVLVRSLDGGPSITSSSKLITPFSFEYSGVYETDMILKETLNIISAYGNTITFGDNSVTVVSKKKPSSDIEVQFLAKN